MPLGTIGSKPTLWGGSPVEKRELVSQTNFKNLPFLLFSCNLEFFFPLYFTGGVE